MQTKTIIVLANSLKLGGRCVAGREVQVVSQSVKLTGGWVRPVRPAASSKHGELYYTDIILGDRKTPQVLDVLRVPVVGNSNDTAQPENWDIDLGKAWTRITSASPEMLMDACENPTNLWMEGNEYSDRIPVKQHLASEDRRSLVLIRPTQLKIWKAIAGRQIEMRCLFQYAGQSYNLKITDDSFTRESWRYPEGSQPPNFGDDCFLCVSLGAPYKGWRDNEEQHYKLIASIIPAE